MTGSQFGLKKRIFTYNEYKKNWGEMEKLDVESRIDEFKEYYNVENITRKNNSYYYTIEAIVFIEIFEEEKARKILNNKEVN